MATAPRADPTAPDPAPALAAVPGTAQRLADLDPVTRRQVRRTMRWAVAEGSLAQAFLNATTGSVLVGFMLHLGATPTELALVAAVPHLSQLASPVAAFLAAALGRRKWLTLAMGLGSRLTWLAAAAVPMVPLPDGARPWAIVVVALVASLFLAAQNTLWTAWMGDVVPERERGRVFGLRTGVMGVVGTAVNLAVGAFLDAVAAPVSFQVALVVAVAIGLLGVAVYALQVDPPTPVERVRWRELWTVPLRDVAFRRYMRFTLYWNFVVMLSGPFVTPFFLDELGMTFTQVAFASSLTALTALVTTPLWGRVADRIGHRPVLALGTVLVGLLLPGGWVLAGLTGQLGWIWATAVADAVGWGPVRLAAFNLALAAAPPTNRVVFVAMYALGTGVAGFLGGVASGPLLLGLTRLEGTLVAAPWSGYSALFAIAGVLRLQAWWFLLPAGWHRRRPRGVTGRRRAARRG
jgi:MFS family permease